MGNEAKTGRLDPIKLYLFEKGMSMAELSRRCERKLSRHGVAYRVRVGDCLLEDMEDMEGTQNPHRKTLTPHKARKPHKTPTFPTISTIQRCYKNSDLFSIFASNMALHPL